MKVKEMMRKATAFLLLTTMNLGSIGANITFAADENVLAYAETQPRGTLAVKVNTVGGTVEISTDGTNDTQIIRKEADKTTLTDAAGNVTEAQLTEDGYAVVLEADEGTIVHTKVTGDTGYDIATYRITSDSGAEDVQAEGSVAEKEVAISGNQVLEVGFSSNTEDPEPKETVEKDSAKESEESAEADDTLSGRVKCYTNVVTLVANKI